MSSNENDERDDDDQEEGQQSRGADGQSEDISTDSDEDDDDEDILIKPKDLIFQSSMNERKWLRSRGKEHMIDFEDDELKKLQQCFTSLVDDEGSDSIGVDELEDPLIALGLVDNR